MSQAGVLDETLTLDDVLTDEEAAKKLRLSVGQLKNAARKGEVPAKKIGRNWVFKESELARWLADWKPNTFNPNKRAKEILEEINGKKKARI